MRFVVPQDISIQDKIIFGLSFFQLLYILWGLGLMYIIFLQTNSYWLSFPWAGVGVAFALIRFQDMTLAQMILAVFLFLFHERKRYFQIGSDTVYVHREVQVSETLKKEQERLERQEQKKVLHDQIKTLSSHIDNFEDLPALSPTHFLDKVSDKDLVSAAFGLMPRPGSVSDTLSAQWVETPDDSEKVYQTVQKAAREYVAQTEETIQEVSHTRAEPLEHFQTPETERIAHMIEEEQELRAPKESSRSVVGSRNFAAARQKMDVVSNLTQGKQPEKSSRQKPEYQPASAVAQTPTKETSTAVSSSPPQSSSPAPAPAPAQKDPWSQGQDIFSALPKS